MKRLVFILTILCVILAALTAWGQSRHDMTGVGVMASGCAVVGQAAKHISEGYGHAMFMDGGVNAWTKAGYKNVPRNI